MKLKHGDNFQDIRDLTLTYLEKVWNADPDSYYLNIGTVARDLLVHLVNDCKEERVDELVDLLIESIADDLEEALEKIKN